MSSGAIKPKETEIVLQLKKVPPDWNKVRNSNELKQSQNIKTENLFEKKNCLISFLKSFIDLKN